MSARRYTSTGESATPVLKNRAGVARAVVWVRVEKRYGANARYSLAPGESAYEKPRAARKGSS